MKASEHESASVLLPYVNVSAELLCIELADGQANRVADHLLRTFAMAQLLENFPMTAVMEPDHVYCPAPYPAGP